MKYFHLSIILLSLVLMQSCSDINDIQNATIDKSDINIAIPLVNTALRMNTLSDRLDGNTSIVIDSEGRPTIKYSGDIIRSVASDLFPVFPAIFDIPIDGNNSTWNLETLAAVTSVFEDNIIRKAIFRNNNIFFKLQHAENEDINFTITIPEFTLNDEPFTMTYSVPPRMNDTDIFFTESSSIDGYTFTPTDNAITFQYTAVNSSGENVDLTFTAMKLDFLNFSYVEGYFGDRVFDVQGDVIDVGLYSNWLGGGLEFEDPRLTVIVENSFGFPVKTDFKELKIKTINNTEFDIESTIIDEGINFNYPSLDEVGQVKVTQFDFNRDNSNIEQLFIDKVASVSYDIDALANPDSDPTINGFLNTESYFLIKVSIDLPLKGVVRELMITDTVDFNISDYDEVSSGEFKFVMRNDFPANVTIQAKVINEAGQVIDELFDDDGLLISAAVLGPDGRTIKGDPTIQYLDISEARYSQLRTGSRIALIGTIDSESVSTDFLWLYDDYAIDFKLGAILNISE